MTRPRIIERNLTPTVTLRRALSDPALLGNALKGKSWARWPVLLLAAFGEALTPSERVLYKELIQCDHEPRQRVDELVGVIGRRGGKSRAISVAATYIAGLCEHPSLVPGERGVLLIIAQDQKQADICLDYITANFEASPILSQLIESRTQRTLRLRNHIDVEVRASDFRSLRGPTYVAVIADELAFWMNENSANPDDEILNAVRPGLGTTGGPMFLISSPYARGGELFRLYDKHYGPDGDPLILVAQASSKTMNPSLPQRVVDRAYERDAASANAEYGAQFRTDVESFVTVEAVRACVSTGILERPPNRGLNFIAFIDPSGGSVDSMCMAIAHKDHLCQAVTIDLLREAKPPFSPEAVCVEFSNVMKSYGISAAQGDRFANQWPVEVFARYGIRYEQSAEPKSALYIALLPLLNSRRIHLLDIPRLHSQLLGLERRVPRGGKESIDHAPGGHDDCANVIAGCAVAIMSKPGYSWDAFQPNFKDLDAVAPGVQPPPDPYGIHAAQQANYAYYLLSHGTARLW
jgi:hypothetical protein